jgi:hypothetical protein
MKKMLANFGIETLNRSQMIEIKGGMCVITFDTVNGGCGAIKVTKAISQAQAVAYADSQMGGSINGSSPVNGYNVNCNQQ